MGKATSWLTSLTLFLIHVVYSLVNAAASLRAQYCARDPLPLAAPRNKVPAHLAVLLASDEAVSADHFEGELLANIERVVSWCKAVGIKRLTVYDRKGILARSSYTLRAHLQPEAIADACDSSDSDIEYPLTPPLSDDSGSRPLTPQHNIPDVPPKLHVTTLRLLNSDYLSSTAKKRHSSRTLSRRHLHRNGDDACFIVHIVSRDSGKAAISNAATRLARQAQSSSLPIADDSRVIQNDMNAILEGKHGFPSPDLMIIHNVLPLKRSKNVLELHGFPPWQIRLTEFHYNSYPSSSWSRWRLLWKPPFIPLEEVEFRRALDEYSGAQMRQGK